MKRFEAFFAIVVFAMAITAAIPVFAGDDTARIASQYAAWAGGRSNADALVKGMASGSSITLVTHANGTRSLAGFTPPARMSPEEISSALASAKQALARLGIRQPAADQIQAALIGGEITASNGKARLVQGSLAARPELSTVAAR